MSVGNQDGVQFTDLFQVVRRLGVLREEGIYDDLLAIRGDEPECGVPEEVILVPPSICSTIFLRTFTKHDKKRTTRCIPTSHTGETVATRV